MTNHFLIYLTQFLCLSLSLALVTAKASPPYADIHVHFNWDQKEVISAKKVVDKLRAGNAEFAVVAGTPSRLALELAEAGGDFIIPLFSPYTHVLGRQDWYRKEETLRQAEEGLNKGVYQGIGEVHFMAGFRPGFSNEIFRKLLEMAGRYEVPVLIHVDAANASRFIELCSEYDDLKIIFAHAGGHLKPGQIRKVVKACDNVAIEFSARDPWRYGGLTDDKGALLPGWREVIMEYPNRFVVGTDPVWRVTRTQAWDQSDDGWDYYEQILDWLHRWMADLPDEVQQKLRLDNARALFGRGSE